MRFLGIQLTGVSPGAAEVHLPASRWLLNAYGVLYGGAIALVADLAMNSALWTLLPKATSFAPLDLSVNFIRAVTAGSGDLRFRATVTHPGRAVAVVSCQAVDTRDKLIASAVETILVLPGRPWERPVNVGDEVPIEQSR